MVACAPVNDPFQCPTRDELWRQIIALLPRGRAWQTHEQIFDRYDFEPDSEVGPFEIGVSPIGVFDLERLTVMQQFWLAYAELLATLNQRACDLVEEMFCDTVSELLDEWYADLGLPDGCGPWRTLCEKVNAVGGCTIAYLVGLAADLGWTIEVTEPDGTILVNVLLSQSPAYVAAGVQEARAGAARTGFNYAAPQCPPGAETVVCLIKRFKPANIAVQFAYDGVIL